MAQKVGSYSLAGQQMKFSATRQWVWQCANCGAEGPAEIEVKG